MSMKSFKIQIPATVLDDLQERLERTRWPDEIRGAGWDYGTNLDYLKSLVDYWHNQFDWRAQEAKLNQFAQFRADVNGFGIHFIHERGKGSNPLPIILSHGWPDSFFRMYKIIPLLSDPASHGGDPANSFDVVVPSLPGFGFSDRPTENGFTSQRIAELFAKLMRDELGYTRFGAHGGDRGSGVTEQLASHYTASLVGIHLTDVPFYHLFTVPQEDLSEAERQYLELGKQWQIEEGAYGLIQATKPQSLAYGLHDSPAGLAGWIVEKFRSWSDCDGDVEKRFTKDELLTNLTIYWATETINSSCRAYYDEQHNQPQEAEKRIEVPTGVAIFPKDPISAPRDYAERFFNVQRWTAMPRGGHFAALEEPDLLAEDIRAFFRPLRDSTLAELKK